MNNLYSIERKVKESVDSVANDPEGRFKLRKEFYSKYGFGHCWNRSGYGNSELDFLNWEIKRGVLNPLDSNHPGSHWWREVNSEFIYNSELAGAIYESGIKSKSLSNQVQLWIEYIENPNEDTWYRAHNSSIIMAYLNKRFLIYLENYFEIIFVNMVLYRVLYAQAMVEEKSILGEIGEFIANPIFDSVELIVSLKDFYPLNYPLEKEDYIELIGDEFSWEDTLVNLLDRFLIKPHITELYQFGAQVNMIPELLRFLNNKEPNYPCMINNKA